jgi:ubiquitin-activating enzyme E1
LHCYLYLYFFTSSSEPHSSFFSFFILIFDAGEQPRTAIVSEISVDEVDGKRTLTVACVDDTRIDFSDGDHVTFSEVSFHLIRLKHITQLIPTFDVHNQVQGLTGLNNAPPMPLTVKSPFSFTVPCPDSLTDTTYVRGGIATQVKMPKVISFRSFGEVLRDPKVSVNLKNI